MLRARGATLDAASAVAGVLDPLQAEVARIALAAAGHGFALAGGQRADCARDPRAAHRRRRPVHHRRRWPRAGGSGVITALTDAGYTVRRTGPTGAGGDYVQLVVADNRAGAGREVLLELARDWRAHPPVALEVGPVLDLVDALAAKVIAMVSRGLPRDFIDVAAVLPGRSRDELIALALAHDPGLPPEDFVLAVRRLDALPDDVFTDYHLDAEHIDQLRRRFDDWPRDL